MMSMIMINMLMSISMMMMKHPLSMGVILLMQTLSVSLTTNFLSTSWFSYILFLVMIGGLLILFMYMTNVASNKKFKISIYSMMMMLIMMVLLMIMKKMMFNYNMNINNEYFMLTKFLLFPSNMMLMMLMLYLFLTLIAAVKITKFKMGPFRLN